MTGLSEFTKRKLVTANEEMPVNDVFNLMQNYKIRHIPVVTGSKPVGVLSDRDVFKSLRLDADGAHVSPHKAKDIMTPNPICADPHAEMEDLAASMVHYKIDSILITQRGKLVGIVTSFDLLKFFCQQQLAQGRVASLLSRAS